MKQKKNKYLLSERTLAFAGIGEVKPIISMNIGGSLSLKSGVDGRAGVVTEEYKKFFKESCEAFGINKFRTAEHKTKFNNYVKAKWEGNMEQVEVSLCEMYRASQEVLTEAEGKDLDNDGDIDSDDYLAAKDKAIKKAMGKEDADEAEE